jgi:hypothetical protein
MKTGMGLTLIGIGAIFAFAVNANTSVFNMHTAGYVVMIIGILGLAIPRSGYGWVGRRLFVREARVRPGRRGVEEVTYPTYVTPSRASIAAPTHVERVEEASDLSTEPRPGEAEVIEDIYED